MERKGIYKVREESYLNQPRSQGKFATDREAPLTKTVTVRVSVELSQLLKSLGNKQDWIRQAIAEKLERDGILAKN